MIIFIVFDESYIIILIEIIFQFHILKNKKLKQKKKNINKYLVVINKG
jgi:hypothetical protein